MKKIISILIVSMMLLFCVGCTHTYSGNRLKEGTYISEEDFETEEFSKGRFVIKKISKKTFESSNGINVLKVNYSDYSSSFYYSFNIFLFSKILNQEQLVEVANFEYRPDMGSYNGDAYLKILDKEYQGEIRMDYYNPVGVSLFDFSCRYYLEKL